LRRGKHRKHRTNQALNSTTHIQLKVLIVII
jgi:hypothetical protein